jgi:hypothetical protein
MRAVKKARLFIANKPESDSAKLLARLVLALESETEFSVADLYRLDYDSFKLALHLLDEWRLDRYYAGKGRLFDLSVQLGSLQSAAQAEPKKD